MTKKELRWRFKNLPTVSEVQQLIDVKVITAEEARELLFNEGDKAEASDREKDLQRQIEFLEDLVKELSTHRNTVQNWPVYITKYVEKWPNPYPTIWYRSGTSGNTYTQTSAVNYTQSLLN